MKQPAKLIPTQIHMLKRVEYAEGDVIHVAHEGTEYDCKIIGGDVCVVVDGVVWLVKPGEFEVVQESYEIQLNDGHVTIVDPSDFERVSQYSWRARQDHKMWYASAPMPRKDGHRLKPLLHRFILGDAANGLSVDHKNRNGLDNRRSNLRMATPSQNAANRGVSMRNKLGIKGVTRNGRLYYATIMHHGKRHNLGGFNTLEEAANAYRKKARELFGEFASV